ncbi:MAG: hypothetical protein ACHREM_01290 [Polyangiales bacterium]
MTTKLDDLRAHLRAHAATIEASPLPGEVPGSVEGFVVAHGNPFASAPLTADEQRVVDAAIKEYRSIHRRFHPRQCFWNSQALLGNDESETLVYVEGFAWTHALKPVLHGWLSLNGKVIDVTLPATTMKETKLREPRQVIGEFEGRTYLGVPFERAYVRQRRNETGSYGVLIGDEEHGFPLLRLGPVGAVIGAR